MTRKERWQLLADFTNWLFTDLDEPLPKEVIKVLNHKILISCVFKNPYANKFINEYLNTINIYQIPIEDLALFIKKIVKQYGLRKKDIWWFSNLEFQDKFPTIPLTKPYEKQFLSEWVKEGIVDNKFIKRRPRPMKDTSTKQQQESNKTEHEVRQNYDLNMIRNGVVRSKESRDKCRSCGLYDQPIVTFDSNKQDDIRNVDILFIAEAPGADEVKQGVPLIGRAGQLFRQYLHKYFDDMTWFITNTCLCRPPDNRKPTDQEIEACSDYVDYIIDSVKPKIIVALGSTPMQRLTGEKSGILSKRGEYAYKGYPVYVTVHPSYILRNPNKSDIYDEDFYKVRSKLLASESQIKVESSSDVKSIYSIQLPEKYYIDYDLVDVFLTNKGVKYVFRHKNSKQLEVYYDPNIPTFYYYMIPGKHKHIVHEKELEQIAETNNLKVVFDSPVYNGYNEEYDITYFESDIKIESRHVIDYNYNLHKLGKENTYQPRVCFIDIEVLAEKFPKPEEAKYPITLITCKYIKDDETYNVCYILDNKDNVSKLRSEDNDTYLNVIDQYDLKFFSDERDLILAFINDLKSQDIDIITAWNVSFDIGYIANRMQKLKLGVNLLSRFDNDKVYIDVEKHYIKLPGFITIDLLTAYKFITPNKRESYSLDYIVRYEGIQTEGKKFKGSKFYELWNENRIYAIAYNIEDVELIYKLDKKLAIIDFINEFRKVTSVPFGDFASAAKTSDSLILLFAKERGKLVRTRVSGQSGYGTKVGAYVYNPIPGLHKFVFEGDFASLYPSIIQTLNISPNTYVMKFVNELEDVVNFISGVEKEYPVIVDPIYNPKTVNLEYEDLKNLIETNRYVIGFGGGIFKHPEDEMSILSEIIAYLKERRKYYKKLYAETNEFKYYLYQLAYKIALNSLYGFLGFEGSRFMHVDLVNNVTLTGQMVNKFSAYTFVKLMEEELKVA